MLGLAFAAGLASAQSAATPAANTQQQIDQLQQQLDQLKQQQKTDEAVASNPANASVTADTSGFTIKSSDGNFLLKIGADIQIDNRSFFGVGSQGLSDTILLRRVRPTFSGTVYKYVDYFIRPDFGQGAVVIYDAYAELKYFNRAKLRVGKFKPPVGLELFCLSWKWRERSAVKITERAHEKDEESLLSRREGSHFEGAFAGSGADLDAMR